MEGGRGEGGTVRDGREGEVEGGREEEGRRRGWEAARVRCAR